MSYKQKLVFIASRKYCLSNIGNNTTIPTIVTIKREGIRVNNTTTASIQSNTTTTTTTTAVASRTITTCTETRKNRLHRTSTTTKTTNITTRHSSSTTTTTPATTSFSSPDSNTVRVLVVGSGIIGLRTAWELLLSSSSLQDDTNTNNTKKKIEVVVMSSRTPYDELSCSIGAGGLWMPFRVAESSPPTTPTQPTDPMTDTVKDTGSQIDQWAISTLDEYYPLGLDSSNELVEIVPAVRLLQESQGGIHPLSHYNHSPGSTVSDTSHLYYQQQQPLPYWTTDERIQFQHLPIEMLSWQNMILKLRIPSQVTIKNAGYNYAWLFYPPVVDTGKMLQHLDTKICNHPNTIHINYTRQPYTNFDEIINDAITMNCSVIVNCTGFGSRSLCNDDTVIGVRGIMHLYDRITCQRQVDVVQCPLYGQTNTNDTIITVEDGGYWIPSIDDVCYMIPRGRYILIGGTVKECTNDNDRIISEHDYNQLRTNAYNLGIDTDTVQPIKEWVGYRPYRTTNIRCEYDPILSTTTTTTTNNTNNNTKKSIAVYHNYGFGGSGWTLNVGAAKHITNLITSKFV